VTKEEQNGKNGTGSTTDRPSEFILWSDLQKNACLVNSATA
jgi:hypothetical protein